MEVPSRKIRIGEAAAAIGSTSKALRHWISRYSDKGLKPTAEQTGGWLEFSFGDVAALSITKYLVDLGMSAHGAFTVAMGIVKQRWPNLFNNDDPNWTVNYDNAVMYLYLTRDGQFPWGFGSFERSEVNRRDLDDDTRVLISVLLSKIISDAFAALEEMGHALPKCDQSELREKETTHA
jgi:MerR HTH family regulatory protein